MLKIIFESRAWAVRSQGIATIIPRTSSRFCRKGGNREVCRAKSITTSVQPAIQKLPEILRKRFLATLRAQ